MDNKLRNVLAMCCNKSNTFTLTVGGNVHEDTRRLLGFQLPGQRKVTFEIRDVVRFKLADFRLLAKELHFDLNEIPTESTRNVLIWKIAYREKPIHLDWIRSVHVNGVLPVATPLQPYTKEIVLA